MRVKKLLGLTLYTFITVVVSTFFLFIIIGYLLNSFNVIEGSSNITSVSRQFTSEKKSKQNFTSIKNSTQFNIILKKSDSEKITISAEDNLINQIQTKIRNNQLQIELEKVFPYISSVNIKNNFPIDIVVEYIELDEVIQAGSGYITTYESELLQAENLELKVTGTGQINLNIDTTSITTSITGAGSLKLSGNTKNYHSENLSTPQNNVSKLVIGSELSTD